MASADAWHTRDRHLMTWAIRVPIQHDESISSWLVRAALRQGCDPLSLTGSVWPRWRVWTVDVDRGLTDNRLQTLVAQSGIEASRFVSAALHTDARRIAGCTLPATEVWPWVQTLGSRNRRRFSGQQFCPTCLADDKHPYFRRQWRFAWHVACQRHRILLVDRCGACGAPIAFHRLLAEDTDLAVCSRCRADLRQVACNPVSGDALTFQGLADAVLSSGSGEICCNDVTTVEWFHAARFFVGTVRRTIRHPASKLAKSIRALGLGKDLTFPMVTGLPLEAQPVSERASLFGASLHLLKASPAAWLRALRDNGVSDVALLGVGRHLPAPLAEVVSPAHRVRRAVKRRAPGTRAAPRPEEVVKRAWMRLQRRIQAEDP